MGGVGWGSKQQYSSPPGVKYFPSGFQGPFEVCLFRHQYHRLSDRGQILVNAGLNPVLGAI